MLEKPLVFDSWALLAHFFDDPGGTAVGRLLEEAKAHHVPRWITTIHAGELWYITARRTSAAAADEALARIHDLRIRMIDVDWPLVYAAARYKSRYRLSYADAFAAAAAKARDAEVVTGDPEFKALEGEVRVRWVA